MKIQKKIKQVVYLKGTEIYYNLTERYNKGGDSR